jgi:hypothetical protein
MKSKEGEQKNGEEEEEEMGNEWQITVKSQRP